MHTKENQFFFLPRGVVAAALKGLEWHRSTARTAAVRPAAEPRHSIDRAPAETALSPDGIVRATSCGHVDGALTVGGQKAS